MGSYGLSCLLRGTLSIACTTSMPRITRPKIVCLPFSHAHGAQVMKNWLPLVHGPAFAMASTPGASKRKSPCTSSSNSLPQMDAPPVPAPATWRIDCGRGRVANYLQTCAAALGSIARLTVTLRVACLDHETRNNTMKEQVVVVARLRMATKVFHRFGRTVRQQAQEDVTLRRMYNRLCSKRCRFESSCSGNREQRVLFAGWLIEHVATLSAQHHQR